MALLSGAFGGAQTGYDDTHGRLVLLPTGADIRIFANTNTGGVSVVV